MRNIFNKIVDFTNILKLLEKLNKAKMYGYILRSIKVP